MVASFHPDEASEPTGGVYKVLVVIALDVKAANRCDQRRSECRWIEESEVNDC